MDKAIEKIKWLQDVFVTRKEQQHFDVDVTIKDAFAEAIAELQAYKAKIEELKECCKTQILLNDEKFIEAEMPEKSAYYQGLSRGYQNMLDSLEKNT